MAATRSLLGGQRDSKGYDQREKYHHDIDYPRTMDMNQQGGEKTATKVSNRGFFFARSMGPSLS